MQKHVDMLPNQLETLAGELDEVKKAPAGSRVPGGKGVPQFFNPKIMQPEIFSGCPREKMWHGQDKFAPT